MGALIEMFPPVTAFLMNSRTFEDAPIHHHNFLKFIWMQIGPYQLMRKSKLIMKKMESGGYTDLKIDTEMIQREKPGKVELSRVQKREISHKRKKLNQVKFLQRYPSSQQPQESARVF